MKYKRWVQFAFIAFVPSISFGQASIEDTLRNMEMQRLQMETQRLQIEAQTARMRAETDRMTSDLAAREAQERAEQAAAEQANAQSESARKAEEAADDLRDEISRVEVRAKNTFFLAGLTVAAVAFTVFAVMRKRRSILMREHEQFGLVAIIISFLLATFALMVSENWAAQLDFFNNVMVSLQIRLIEEYNGRYYIDFPTKYFLLACLSAAAYGFTTYLGITPMLKRKTKMSESDVARQSYTKPE